MRQSGPETRLRTSRILIATVLVAVSLLGGAYLFQLTPTAPMLAPAGQGPAGQGAAGQGAAGAVVPAGDGQKAEVRAVAPSFDLVRVSPRGEVVIAGRAEPGAQVVVRDGGQEIARVQADRQGAFVATPKQALAEGGRSLTLSSTGADAVTVPGDGAIIVVVPPRSGEMAPGGTALGGTTLGGTAPGGIAPGGMGPGALAVLVPNAAAPRVLQDNRGASGPVGLDSVDYDDKGAIRFAGRAAANGVVRVYVDNKPVGDAVIENGRWTLMPRAEVPEGMHRLRIDRLDASGRVQARMEVPFQRASIPSSDLAGGRIVVQPGQSLWRMARTVYGSGVRYTVIYLANREQIRDPRLIYPGQVIALPATTP